ncbi:Adagio protein 1-like [Mycena indigotica]|uniref:Adagio protein 1-like n=1 Tax=Mycena indigotica TaxID=2126181 RepID=A0A8H6WC86_9AGAR|nr:Adagio protein 1-like [Mycena indigotica]KAF7312572.1 Adagio protein 1-like [Mycena indigotica]
MTIYLYIALLISAVHSYTPAPRWGQATSIVTSSLFVQGGKQDPFGSMSYTGANAQSDLLLLPLALSFSVDNPPWVLVSDPNNSTNSHGPAVAWHTMSAFNNSNQLVFGGVPTPVATSYTQPDSAWLLNIFNRAEPQFTQEPPGWDGEPPRRMHHTSVTSRSGDVYVFGGEKADGSMILESDHYVFSPSAGTFTLLPTANAAPALTGHGTVILSNGQIFLFGGLAQNSLLPFDTFYIFDTTKNSWSTQTISGTPLPAPRRAFAYVLLDDSAILIQGGTSGDFLSRFSDGWIYNITTSTWTLVPPLAQLGERRDHFAVYYGGQVLFGFGYGSFAPVSSSLTIYDPATQSFPTTFNPPPPNATITPTLPLPPITKSDTTPTFSGTLSSVHPTSTNGSGGGGSTGDQPKAPRKTTAIAIGTVLGVFAFVAAGLGVVWLMRRHERQRWMQGGVGGVFSPLDGGESGNGPSAARMVDAPPQRGIVVGAVDTIGAAVGSWATWIAGGLGLAAATGAPAVHDRKERRDMLADEDNREFGYEGWYDVGDNRSTRSRLERLRQGSGGSTWSLMSVFRPNPRRQASAASGISYGSRGESLLGVGDEKDPFQTYMRDAPAGRAARPPPGRRQSSYTSVMSTTSNYVDPFADPVAASEQDITAPGVLLAASRPGMLSPVTEVSRSSGASNSGSSVDHHTSSASVINPFDSLSRVSTFGMSSNSHQNSPFGPSSPAPTAGPSRPRTSSILDMRPPQPDQPMRRSDTWWARFSNKSLLDRRSTRGANEAPAPMDFRDPAPLPSRLGFVKEETASVLAERNSSDGSQKQRDARSSPYSRMSTHGKSMSSIQTANSDALERMGDVGVMLRGTRQSGSTSTRGSDTTHGGSVDDGRSQIRTSWQPPEDEGEVVFSSPVEMVPASSFNLPTPPPAPASPSASSKHSPPASIRPPLSTASSGSSAGSVADRVRAYERRMSQDVSPPPKERPRNKSHANYGLVTRPSLFVANPGPNRDASGSQDA